jgi:hypothetical protein
MQSAGNLDVTDDFKKEKHYLQFLQPNSSTRTLGLHKEGWLKDYDRVTCRFSETG